MNKYTIIRLGKYRLSVFLTVFALLFMAGAVSPSLDGNSIGQNVPSVYAGTLNSSFASLGIVHTGRLFSKQPNRHATNTPHPTNTPRPSHTARPANTPRPTNTSIPTNPPAATDTPRATDVPASTDTPVPPNPP